MPNVHEMDLVDHSGDDYDDLGADSQTHEIVARFIKEDNSGFNGSEEQMLGLGAGQAYAELGFADLLGIPYGNVALLDRHFGALARLRISNEAPQARRIESGLFTYLSHPDGSRYSLVTTFGLHDFFEKSNIEEFLRLLPNVLQPEALAFIYYFPGGLKGFSDFHELTSRYGFECLDGFYVFRYQAQEKPLEDQTSSQS